MSPTPVDQPSGRQSHHLTVNPLYVREPTSVPRNQMPEQGLDPEVSVRMIQDELMLDGNARLNLATFVTTWMEPEAERLMMSCLDKNMIDKDEYPQTAELESRCVAMLAKLWHAPEDAQPFGCSTTGSSEAAMLAGLALKRRWQQRRSAAGESTERPNIAMGVNVQVCWDKFARYWDVEPRLVPMDGDRFHLSPEGAVELCDENTIGVVAILGSTFDGSYEPVAQIAGALDELQAKTGLDVPLHVDAASGGFVAPFLDPELEWDFRLPRVASINASGHKYGLVYPGVGWALWRDHTALPEDLVFRVSYLGGDMPTFALNFSRPGAQVAAQYYNLVRLGTDGYTRVHQRCRNLAMHLSSELSGSGDFVALTRGDELPVFAVALAPDIEDFSVYEVAAVLRQRGWLVPAYPFPENRTDLHVLRFVIRNGLSEDLGGILLTDIENALKRLKSGAVKLSDASHQPRFTHGAAVRSTGQ